jgi:membrane-associated phospholipid phosphatase
LKAAFGRSRPRDEQGVAHFEPFSNSNASFPSGHTTEAFAVASVISEHYDDEWVKAVSYGTASMVGFARVYHNAHFTSDVLAGALIGMYTGKSVVSFNNRWRESHVVFMPMIGPDEKGLMLQARF